MCLDYEFFIAELWIFGIRCLFGIDEFGNRYIIHLLKCQTFASRMEVDGGLKTLSSTIEH